MGVFVRHRSDLLSLAFGVLRTRPWQLQMRSTDTSKSEFHDDEGAWVKGPLGVFVGSMAVGLLTFGIVVWSGAFVINDVAVQAPPPPPLPPPGDDAGHSPSLPSEDQVRVPCAGQFAGVWISLHNNGRCDDASGIVGCPKGSDFPDCPSRRGLARIDE